MLWLAAGNGRRSALISSTSQTVSRQLESLSVISKLWYGAPSTPVSAVFASMWPRASASERHSVELQRHLAVILKRTLSSEQATIVN
jgi:hypothetical protein